MRLAPLLALPLLLTACAALADSPRKTVHAVRTDHPPILDGTLNDPEWRLAPSALDFTQFDPAEGALPTEVTSVRILYDNRALYVGVICYDAHPEKIVRQLTRRDRTGEADRFTVMIDSYHDKQTAFVFSTNVSGVQSDGVLSQDGSVYDITWDAVWTVKTRVYNDGWSAEFEIPYNALRFAQTPGTDQVWGINFRRYISRKKETDEWVMVPRKESLQIAHWGEVDGLSNIEPPLHLDLQPYVSGTTTFHEIGSAYDKHRDIHGQAGFDLKYGVARNFTLDATVNPDFGQVEVDQTVVNLTVFEPFYPEKRPFFVEGASLFTFGSSADMTPLSLFFSRRIGKTPSGGFPFGAGDAIVDDPLVTTILGAAKLTGRTSDGLSIGALSAATDEMFATVKSASGATTKTRTEPRGSYSVLRLRQDFDGSSWLGGLATVAARQGMNPAGSAGIDWNYRFGGGEYTLDGYVAGARSSEPTTKISGLSGTDGWAGRLLFTRIAADHWQYAASYSGFSRFFDINDMGYFAQPHDHGGFVQGIYHEYFASEPFRRYSISVVPEARWSWNSLLTKAMVEAIAVGDFTNFWSAQLTYDFFARSYDDEEKGVTGTYRRPTGHLFALTLLSDERQNLSGSLRGSYEFNARQKKSFTALANLNLRVTSWIELAPAAYYERTRHDIAGVLSYPQIATRTVGGATYSVFGARDLDEVDFALRGTITFTRTLSLQFYSQLVLAKWTYKDAGLLTTSTDITPSPTVTGTFDDNQAIFHANALIRWEYLPGSTLYLVWTQGRAQDNLNYATGFTDRVSDIFREPHEDVIALKVSYFLPF